MPDSPAPTIRTSTCSRRRIRERHDGSGRAGRCRVHGGLPPEILLTGTVAEADNLSNRRRDVPALLLVSSNPKAHGGKSHGKIRAASSDCVSGFDRPCVGRRTGEARLRARSPDRVREAAQGFAAEGLKLGTFTLNGGLALVCGTRRQHLRGACGRARRHVADGRALVLPSERLGKAQARCHRISALRQLCGPDQPRHHGRRCQHHTGAGRRSADADRPAWRLSARRAGPDRSGQHRDRRADALGPVHDARRVIQQWAGGELRLVGEGAALRLSETGGR